MRVALNTWLGGLRGRQRGLLGGGLWPRRRAAFDPVIGISWPRSGHHHLAGLLRDYFGPGFVYGAKGDARITAAPTKDEPHFSCHHDPDGRLPQVAGRKYLVQHCDFAAIVVANYAIHLQSNPQVIDTRDAFKAFASAQFSAYRPFRDKWLLSEFAQNQLCFSHEQLLAYPRDCLRLAIWWINPEGEIDEARVDEVLAAAAAPADEIDVTKFRHYERGLFGQLSRLNLTREEVQASFRTLLGRDPAEGNYLQFQEVASIGKMENALRASEEYRKRAAKAAAENASPAPNVAPNVAPTTAPVAAATPPAPQAVAQPLQEKKT